MGVNFLFVLNMQEAISSMLQVIAKTLVHINKHNVSSYSKNQKWEIPEWAWQGKSIN